MAESKAILDYFANIPGDTYQDDIDNFVNYLASTDRELSIESFLAYREWMIKDQHYAAATVNKRMSALRKRTRDLFNNLDSEKSFKLNLLLQKLKNVKIASLAIDVTKLLTKDEIKILINNVSEKLALFIRFLYHTGLRISEMLSIRITDITDNNEAAQYALIRVIGKGCKERYVKCDKLLIESIRSHFQGIKFLYEIRNHKQYIRQYVSNQIKKYGFHLLGKNISAHTLRHSFATHMIQDGKDVKAVATYLGHSSTATTLNMYVHSTLSWQDIGELL